MIMKNKFKRFICIILSIIVLSSSFSVAVFAGYTSDYPQGVNKAQADKVSALEAKLLCYEHDVAKDCVSDVVALAKAYVDEDTDFEEAIEKVIKKYPQFVKDSGKTSKKRDKDVDEDDDDEDEDETENKSWGKRQTGKGKKVDGVEAAFLKKNPGLKID